MTEINVLRDKDQWPVLMKCNEFCLLVKLIISFLAKHPSASQNTSVPFHLYFKLGYIVFAVDR
jgi:hypothetical protein